MQEIGAFEAKNKLGALLDRVERGEEIIITRHGKPVARLVPIAGRRVFSPEQKAARARARARMEQGWPIAVGPLDRGSLHDR